MENSLFDLKVSKVAKIDTKYRRIETEIPHPNDLLVMKEISKLEASFGQNSLPLVWERASDYSIYDRWGNKWIDLSSGIFVLTGGIGAGMVHSAHATLHSCYYPTTERLNFLTELKNSSRLFGRPIKYCQYRYRSIRKSNKNS